MLELTELKPIEKTRTYTFPGGEKIALTNVTHFLARDSGTHRLRTMDGMLHIVPVGWIHVAIDAEGFSL
jgi:hypothetical protein